MIALLTFQASPSNGIAPVGEGSAMYSKQRHSIPGCAMATQDEQMLRYGIGTLEAHRISSDSRVTAQLRSAVAQLRSATALMCTDCIALELRRLPRFARALLCSAMVLHDSQITAEAKC